MTFPDYCTALSSQKKNPVQTQILCWQNKCILLLLSEYASSFTAYRPKVVILLEPPRLFWVLQPHVGWIQAVMSGSHLGVSLWSRTLQGGGRSRDACGAAGS